MLAPMQKIQITNCRVCDCTEEEELLTEEGICENCLTADCPTCSGQSNFMGILGTTVWYRCRNCGQEHEN